MGWLLTWKEIRTKRSWPNPDTIPKFAWRDWDKLTPWNRVLLEQRTVLRLVKKYCSSYGALKFISTITRTRRFFSILSQMDPVHNLPSCWRPVVITICVYVFPAVSSLQVSPPKLFMHFFSSPIRDTCPDHLVLLGLITLIQGYSQFPDTFHEIGTLEWRKVL